MDPGVTSSCKPVHPSFRPILELSSFLGPRPTLGLYLPRSLTSTEPHTVYRITDRGNPLRHRMKRVDVTHGPSFETQSSSEDVIFSDEGEVP